MKKIVIAIDSFKGCLTSMEAGQAAALGVKSVDNHINTVVIPVADGGEGWLDVLVTATQGKYIPLTAHNPLMQNIKTRYGISGDGRKAIIEMAAISGLPLVPVNKRNPMLTTTFGTGELIRDALQRGCREFIIGIGGSATNDAGLGMLQALGYRFLDEAGQALGTGGQIMGKVAAIDDSEALSTLKEVRFTIACDVRNPFYGPEGAASVFARQKGADDEMIRALDEGMRSLTHVIAAYTGKDIALQPGAGAAGGMGGGFLAFLNAELKPGTKLLLDAIRFREQIKGADLVITGEGKADWQTAMGKVPCGILKEAQKEHIPVVLIAGSVEDLPELNQAGFKGVFSTTPGPVTLEQAMEPLFAKENISRVVAQLCSVLINSD